MAKLAIKAGLDTWVGTAKDNLIAARISELTLCAQKIFLTAANIF